MPDGQARASCEDHYFLLPAVSRRGKWRAFRPMFKVWNDHRISLCGLMVLIAAGPSAATRLGHRDEVPLGDLMCRLQNVDQTDDAGSAQTLDIDCVYQPSQSGAEEFYAGTLSTIGLDDPLKNQSVLAWVVRGPEDADAQPGMLAQSYTAGAGSPEEPAQSLVGDSAAPPRSRQSFQSTDDSSRAVRPRSCCHFHLIEQPTEGT